MTQLNFPEYPFKIKVINGNPCIFDRLRKKYVALQPEEWVRQHMIEFLISEKAYPSSLICNEFSITFNGLKKRCDSVVFDRNGKPLMIIEYKAPTIEITQKTFDQIALYNSQLQVRYLIVSNGIKHFCCQVNWEEKKNVFLQEIPAYTSLI